MSVFVLHGPSSVGKTTVGRALQRALGHSCVYVSVDDLWPALPEGLPVGAKVFTDLNDVLFAQAARWAALGYDVVVDTVFERPECATACTSLLAACDALMVALRCPLPTLEEREARRGDRPLGLARGQAGRVYDYVASDLTVDTETHGPEGCAAIILAAMNTHASMPG
ncbi:MAG: AAA family ATPase [Polyangiales bacterium]